MPSSDPPGDVTSPERRPAPPPARRLLRWLIGVAAFGVVVIGLGFLAVPPLVKSKLESELSTALDRRTTVERVAFNPFTLTATLEGLVVRNRGADTPLFALGSAVANISTASLWRRAPVIDALSVRAPELHLVRNDDGTYNIQDLIDAFVAAPPGPPPAFSINNIDVSEGIVEFDDRPVKRRHRLDDIAVGLPYLSSLPYETEVKVAPVLKARVNGTPLALTGESTPFADSRQSTLDIDIDRLALPVYLDYVPGGLPVRVASGELTTRFKLSFVDGDATTRALRVAGGFSITDLAVNAPDGTPLARIPAMGFGLERLDVYARTVDIGQIAFERPELGVHRHADGRLDVGLPVAAAAKAPADAAPPATARAAPAPAAGGPAAERPWRFRLAEARVAGARMRVEDATTTPAFQAVVSDLAVTANDISNDANARGRVALSFKTDLGGSVVAEGEVGLEPLTVRGKFDGKGVDLRRLFPYYASALNLEVGEGTLDFAAGFEVARRSPDTTTVALADGAATIRNLRLLLPGEREPLWTVPEIVAGGIAVDVDGRSVTIDELTGRGASARLRREADGTIDWARLMRTDAATGTGPSEPTWQLAINRAALERTTLAFEDRTAKPPVRLRFTELDVRGKDYTNARGKQGTIDAASRVGTTGRIKASGPWTTNPFTARWRVEASGVALAPLQPYLGPHVNATVTSGAAAASGALAIDASGSGAMRASYAGDVGITDFASIDSLTASDLVEWKTLRLTGVDATLAPFKLDLGAVALESFYARVIVYADGTINLTRMLAQTSDKPQTPPAAAPASGPAGGASVATLPEKKELPVTIGRIQLASGNVQYSDFFIRPNYSANLTEVAGSISAMSAQQAGDIAITARVDHSAPVEIRGRINPFAAELDLDLTGKARDIDLPPLTPYSAKYAGYGIEKGKLSFDVHYKVAERRLTAENQIVLDQLTFGERVESPSATKLPVLLAVALLKDRRGVIDVRLPISGSLDDPQFSVGGLIVQVIVNLLTKAVTAPFALIGAVFAGSGGESAWVEFAPGRADLTPATEAKIATLAKALADRPQLKLEITGRYDTASDAPALRRLAVDRAVKAEKRRVLAEEGTAPLELDDVVVAADEYPRYLEAAYKRASFDKPKNALGFVTTLPVPEMEALLLQHAEAGDDALRDLANARAQGVKAAIEKNGEVADARLFLLAPRPATENAKDAGKPNRVDFALR